MTETAPVRRQRLLYVDNLRTFLTVLVVGHHSAIASGASGSWYYVVPPPAESVAPLLLTLFTAVNQAFFMSLFFAISGFFTPGPYAAKGRHAFLRDRLLRLGIPLVAYFFVANPCVVYLSQRFQGKAPDGFVAFVTARYVQLVGTGPLWFVLALLVFAYAYAGWRSASGRDSERPGAHPLPGNARVLRFVIGIGLVAFLVRLAFPVGWQVLGLQLGYFPLYISFFVFGLMAHGSGWQETLEDTQARRWLGAALVAMVALPLGILFGRDDGGGTGAFQGGLSWQAFVYAMWEPILCVGISMRLVVLFRERFREQGALARRMARSAYTAYIIHPFFVVGATALLASPSLPPLLRFAVLWPLATLACFAVSDAVRRAPGLRRIL